MTTPHQPGDAAPPSLFGESASDERGNLRMLSGLDGRDARASKPRARKGLTGALLGCAVVLAVGAAGWWALLSNAAQAPESMAGPRAQAAPPASALQVATAQAPAAEPPTPPLAAHAAIETVSPPPPTAHPVVTQEIVATAQTAAPAVSDVATAPARPAVAASPPKLVTSAHVPPSRKALAHIAQPDAPAAATAMNTQATPPSIASTARRADAAHSDADVELLTAMVGHLENRNVVVTTDGSGSAYDPHATQTIAQLVAECRSLGKREAAQCQQQICASYWGKAQACPERLAPPTPAAPSTATPR